MPSAVVIYFKWVLEGVEAHSKSPILCLNKYNFNFQSHSLLRSVVVCFHFQYSTLLSLWKAGEQFQYSNIAIILESGRAAKSMIT